MTKISTLVVTALAAITIGTHAMAAKKEAGSGPNPYTECGIGGALFPETPWAAVTSNVTWDAGTTALTSATASPETCNRKTVAAATFIYETYDNLAEETARGEGEHLTALLNILESADDVRTAIIAKVRLGMATHIASADYNKKTRIEKSTIYYNLIASTI